MSSARHLSFAVLAALAALWLWTAMASAQLTDQARETYREWQATAERAEEAIANGRASNAALAQLRAELVEYRQQFDRAQEDNAARIRILESQLAALGPPPDPEQGGTEPEDVADARAELRARLQELRVPVLLAQEAFGRANGLISELDRIVRERGAQALLERGPSPVNPTTWPGALRELGRTLDNLWDEASSNLQLAMENGTLQDRLPLVAGLVAIGLVLLLMGRRWAGRLVERLRGLGGRGTGVWSFIASLLRFVLPYIGLVLILMGILLSDALGVRGELLVETLPDIGAVLLAAAWLADRVYAKRDEDALVEMSAPRRAVVRRNMITLAGVYALYLLLSTFEEIENISATTSAVIGFVPILIAATAFFRLNQVAAANLREMESPEETLAQRTGVLRSGPILRRLVGVVAVAGPALALFGYTSLAEALTYRMILTLGVFTLLLALQSFFADLYGWITGRSEAEISESIVPALVSFALVLTALPVLALIWGAAITDLTELWSRFLQGFEIGDTRISPTIFLTFAIVFAIGYTATRMLQGALRTSLLPKTQLDQGGQTAVVSGVGYIGIFLAALIAVSIAGLNLSSLAIVAGALSVGIGFGLQTIVSNFVSGIILLIERPISEGDWIEVNGQMGYVRDISVRATRIETFDRTDVIVPNADLVSGTVTNYTRGKTVGRVIVPVGVAYGTDTRKVETILRDIAEDHPMVLMNPPPTIVFQGFGADSLDFEIRAILRDVNWVLSVKSDMNHKIAERFEQEGIEIPYAQRDIWLRNPETLTGLSNTGRGDETAAPTPETSDT